ncbi:guanine nucleotide-binding protein G(I)/G(S)/G(O) subunit gamma-T2-like [Scleropages formosus]|uniref:Guanine nucleotide-binding protein subunit gamma n=2 Tax=Scleropages formosus TaxID=113540 RepID=A0A0P7UPZ8_SCLFO|nr:guanine nucleotide-binding protein G(I)/G(S)/G(O) subunit gamma-T2-like [Scleropages formosus]
MAALVMVLHWYQGKMARDMSDIDILKMELQQLQKEVKNEREPVSKTAKELVEWVEANSAEDILLKGVPEDKNPFKEKGGCIIT